MFINLDSDRFLERKLDYEIDDCYCLKIFRPQSTIILTNNSLLKQLDCSNGDLVFNLKFRFNG